MQSLAGAAQCVRLCAARPEPLRLCSTACAARLQFGPCTNLNGPPAMPPCHAGYCFVNFLDAQDAGRLYRKYHNQRWEEFNSKKVGGCGSCAGNTGAAWGAG